MERETDKGRRKRILSNLVRIASIAYGASSIYKYCQEGEIDGGGIVLKSLLIINEGNKNANTAKQLTDFLYGGTEKDSRMEYYSIDTGQVWHDRPLYVTINTYDQNRFDAYPSWVFNE